MGVFLDNISKKEVHSDNNSSKLLKGDLVYITTFIDVHHIFVRKVDDEYDDFFNFIEKVNLYCSAGIYYTLTSYELVINYIK